MSAYWALSRCRSPGISANWHTGAPDAIPAVGGAMDLAIGAKDVFALMTLFTKDDSRASSFRHAAIRDGCWRA